MVHGESVSRLVLASSLVVFKICLIDNRVGLMLDILSTTQRERSLPFTLFHLGFLMRKLCVLLAMELLYICLGCSKK